MATAQLGTLLRHLHQLAAGRGDEPRPDRQLLDDFAARQDEAAFATLLTRHGPMVLRVCRHVLGHEQDAEDAFQATFLVLAQNARSIRKRAALAEWLHGVAFRTAMKLKRSAARRRRHEARLQTLTRRPATRPAWDDVQVVLDEEIRRLPAANRAVFVLCILEGRSGPEAAAVLGVAEGTVHSRLTRARQHLRKRLRRRGIELSAVLTALSIAGRACRAAPSAALVHAVLRSGLMVAAGGSAAGVIRSDVAALAAGVTRAMFLTKAKLTTAVILAVTLGLAGAGMLIRQALADQSGSPPTADRPPAQPSGKEAGKRQPAGPHATSPIVFAGRVLSPDGQPVQGARLFLLSPELKTPAAPVRARSDADGSYRFTVSRAEFDRTQSPEPWKHTPAVALAEGYGLGLPLLSAEQIAGNKLPSLEAMTIQLARDDVPIVGRVLDLQGKPVAGVKVRVRGIRWPVQGDLTAFIEALKTRREGALPQNRLLIGFPDLSDLLPRWNLDGLFPPVVTDTRGRFRIQGIGRERVADLLMEEPTIETQYIYVLTRPGATIAVPAYKNPNPYSSPIQPVFTHHGATFDHVAAPSRPVVGVVRDADTGKPIPSAVVETSNVLPVPRPRPIDDRVRFRAVADKDGQYRITGLPRASASELRASPPAGQPYLMSAQQIPEGPGLEPVRVDFMLKRGGWIDVTVTDKTTGKPVRCGLQYFCFDDNPNLKEALGLVTSRYDQNRAEDGTFRLVGLPGRGVVAARADDVYLFGVGIEKIRALQGSHGRPRLLGGYVPEQFHALAEVNVNPDAGPVTCHLVLDPGRTLTGTVVGPDGLPLAGAYARGLNGKGISTWTKPLPLKTATFTVRPLQLQPWRLLFVHREKRLAGTLVVGPDEQGPLTVILQPSGAVTGQLVTREGKPWVDVRIISQDMVFVPGGVELQPLAYGTLLDSVGVDRDGRFRIEGLVPGLNYSFAVVKGNHAGFRAPELKKLMVQSGETRDLGKIPVKWNDE